MNSIRCRQCEHYIEANAGEGKIYGCDRSKCVFEPTTKNDLGVDCIDRKFAISVLNDVFHGAISDSNMRVYEIINWLNELPSVTPQPRKGHWVKGYAFPDGAYWKCDKCNELIKVKYPMHYCNNCGSDNREE